MSTEFLIWLFGIFAGVLEGEAWAGSTKAVRTPRPGGEN